jgi:hypothetical protein
MKRILVGVLVFCVCMTIAAWVGWQRGSAQSTASGPVPDGQVAAHLVGRMTVDAYGNAQLFGYFPYFANLPVAFFSGAPSEATAYFTFRTAMFQLQAVPNGSIMELFSQPIGGSTAGAAPYSIYYNATPKQDFTNPDTFSQGRLIATFNPAVWMATVTPSGALLSDTITLASSSDFTIQSQPYNMRNLGAAVTMVFMFGPSPGGLAVPLTVPFGGYAQQAATSSRSAVRR